MLCLACDPQVYRIHNRARLPPHPDSCSSADAPPPAARKGFVSLLLGNLHEHQEETVHWVV